jgi:hypothetical protein
MRGSYYAGDDCDKAKWWGWVRAPQSGWVLVCYGNDEDTIWQFLADHYPVLHERPKVKRRAKETDECVSLVVLPAHLHPAGGRV